jgi:peptide/nickel transport system permease protein
MSSNGRDIGSLGEQSVGDREYNAIGGAVFVLSTVFVLVNLAVDVLYAFIDPRVRYG